MKSTLSCSVSIARRLVFSSSVCAVGSSAGSAVVAEGYPSVSFAGMSAGVEIDRAIPQLYQTGLPGSIEGKGGTLVPGLAVVIAINRVGVSFSFLMFIVVGHDPRGNKESSLVGAFSQGDAGVTGTIWDG